MADTTLKPTHSNTWHDVAGLAMCSGLMLCVLFWGPIASVLFALAGWLERH